MLGLFLPSPYSIEIPLWWFNPFPLFTNLEFKIQAEPFLILCKHIYGKLESRVVLKRRQ